MNTVFEGDSLEVLKTLEDESVDLLCTDPPYGYSFMGKAWDKTLPDIGIFKECHRVLKPGAFAFVMSAPRSDVCARMMLMLEDAGFEIGFTPIYWTYASGFPKAMNIAKAIDKRAGVEPLEVKKASLGMANNPQWNTLNNQIVMPPATTPEAKALDGSYGGFQPKPAVEVVIVAMKPLSEKTYVDQALKNGKGITWLDDCRVPAPGGRPLREGDYKETDNTAYDGRMDGSLMGGSKAVGETDLGRFPANLLVENSILDTITCTCTNEGSIQIVQEDLNSDEGGTEATTLHAGQLPKNENAEYPKPSKVNGSPQNTEPRSPLHASLFTTSEDGNRTEAPTATVPMDDGCEPSANETETSAFNAEQPKTSTSTTSSPTPVSRNSSTRSVTGVSCALHVTGRPTPTASSQQYSRFFSLDAWAQNLPFLAVPKAAKSEKNAGLDHLPDTNANRENAALTHAEGRTASTKNAHPTVKPLKLMSYLITLGSRPGDVVLDPFLGSGTTAIAAKQLGRQYIGIEREAEYVEIANARLAAVNNTLV